MKALIYKNKIIQIEPEAFPVHESMSWIEAPQGCQPGWVLIDGQWQPQPLPNLTKEQLINDYQQSLQDHIDIKAQEKDYLDGNSCASYANSTISEWSNQAHIFIAWRDACWQYAYVVLNNYRDNVENSPSIDEFIANAPTINWEGVV